MFSAAEGGSVTALRVGGVEATEPRSLHFIDSESKSSTKGRGATLRQRGSVAVGRVSLAEPQKNTESQWLCSPERDIWYCIQSLRDQARLCMWNAAIFV